MHSDMLARLKQCDRASEYYRVAWEYLEGYNVIASQRPADFGDLTSAKLFLLCHALELGMKGWLVLREGLPKSISPQAKRALKRAGLPVPKTLTDYSHHLANIAEAAGKHYPPLLANLPIIKHLTTSYWGSDDVPELRGSRDYEYPEGSRNIHYVPPSELAILVKACIDDLLRTATAERRMVGEALGLDEDESD